MAIIVLRRFLLALLFTVIYAASASAQNESLSDTIANSPRQSISARRERSSMNSPRVAIPPSIIKDIGRAIQFLRDQAGTAVLLVEQYLDFARELADDIAVMDRGRIVHVGPASDLDRADVRAHLTV